MGTMKYQRKRKKNSAPVPDDGCIVEGEITLPAELYWDHVRPFTPVKDRVALNRRSGGTRFYAGDREEIDETYLEKHGSTCLHSHRSDSDEPLTPYNSTFHIKGEPGTSAFRIIFEESNSTVGPAEALEMLRNARAAWDDHLSKMASPTMRLQLCLKLFLFGVQSRGKSVVKMPLFFTGDGSIGDVVRFHASMNPVSINGPPHVSGSRTIFPNTHFGYWLSNYLNWVEHDMCNSTSSALTSLTRDILGAFIDAGVDVNPLLQPLDSPPSQKFYQDHGNGHSLGRFFRGPGTNISQCLKVGKGWYCLRHLNPGNREAYNGFASLIEQLESTAVITQFIEEQRSRLIQAYARGGLRAAGYVERGGVLIQRDSAGDLLGWRWLHIIPVAASIIILMGLKGAM